MKSFSARLLASVLIPAACVPKHKEDAAVAYVPGSWWSHSESNLLAAASRGEVIRYCVSEMASPSPAEFERDRLRIEKLVHAALQEWTSPLGPSSAVKVEKQSSSQCVNSIRNGHLEVVLHYDEALFQSQISRSTASTLGVYMVGEGRLYLNMKGILNPRRDPTGGKKTILHELGHTLGLTHSTTSGAVMQASLSRASAELTNDDVNGVRTIWQRLQMRSESDGSNPSVPPRASQAITPIPSSKTQAGVSRTDGQGITESSKVHVSLRYSSWFKLSTEQSYLLPDSQKCALEAGQVLAVKVLDGGRLTAAHARVQLTDGLPNCQAGTKGALGYLYQPHLD